MILQDIVDDLREWANKPYLYNGLEGVSGFQTLVDLAENETEAEIVKFGEYKSESSDRHFIYGENPDGSRHIGLEIGNDFGWEYILNFNNRRNFGTITIPDNWEIIIHNNNGGICKYCDDTGYEEIAVGESQPCSHCLTFDKIKSNEVTLEQRMSEIEKRMDEIETRMNNAAEEVADELYSEFALRIERRGRI